MPGRWGIVARREFLARAGNAPWSCFFCGEPINRLGSTRNDGVVHHVDGDRFNNDPKNAVPAHRRCHSSYHQSKNNSSPFNSPGKPGGRGRGFGCGHPETPDNIYLRRNGQRECRTCKRRRQREWKHRMRKER